MAKSKRSKSIFLATIRDMGDGELKAKLDELHAEFFREKSKRTRGYSVGQEGSESYARYKNVKNDIARIQTIMNERRMGR